MTFMPSKDAAQQLYRSVFAILNDDTQLGSLLQATTPDNPKIYQAFIDFNASFALKNDQWITFGVSLDSPVDIEQTQDVHEMIMDVHVWLRGPGSDLAEQIAKRCNELLDDTNLSTPQLFAWYCHFAGYNKTFEATPNLWHIMITYRVMCMAIESE